MIQQQETGEEYTQRINLEQQQRHKAFSEVLRIAEEGLNNGIKEFLVTYKSGNTEKRRLFKSQNGTIAIFRKGSKKYGHDIRDDSYIIDKITPINPKKVNPSIKWLKSLDKAEKILLSSGLWTNILEEVRKAREFGYSNFQDALRVYDTKYSEDYKTNEERKFKEMKEKYPILIKKGDTNEYIDSSFLWFYSRPLSIKAMNFGKYNNERVLSEIKKAIESKTKYTSGRFIVNYDVSFEYDGNNKAWYSEEYRNCGNGHYYLALSDKYAMHYEDD
jgi:hypothetical protein